MLNRVELATTNSQLVAPQIDQRGQSLAGAYKRPRTVDGEIVFDVFALGTRGAGKTAFLSALYNLLSVPNNESYLFVDLQSTAQRRFLLQTYEQLTNPGADWPLGTGTINEYEFRCLYFSTVQRKPIPLFRFNYLDYPGGLLTEDTEDAKAVENIVRGAEKAHSILILIDGQKILQSIEGLPTRGPGLNADLNTLMPLLMRCTGCPIHFVITKWDVLQRDYSLKRVKDELCKNNVFRNFVRLRTGEGLPVHLIPVSAVGDHFATFDRSEMQMKKTSGKIDPYNLDMSIGMTVTDQLYLLSRSGYRDPTILFLLLLKLASIFVKSAGMATQVVGLPILRVGQIVALMGAAHSAVGNWEEYLDAKIETTERSITNQRSAIEAVMMILAMMRSKFERKFPDSYLNEAEGIS